MRTQQPVCGTIHAGDCRHEACMLVFMLVIAATKLVYWLLFGVAVGELIEDSESEGDDDEASVEAFEQQQREKLEQEKQAILNNQELIAEVRNSSKKSKPFSTTRSSLPS